MYIRLPCRQRNANSLQTEAYLARRSGLLWIGLEDITWFMEGEVQQEGKAKIIPPRRDFV